MNARAAPVKLSPLHETARDLGAQFTESSGWRIPEAYSTPDAEISAAGRGVALADETANGTIRVEGEEADEAESSEDETA